VTGCFNWDVFVVGEVDTSLGLGRIIRGTEELTLRLQVLWTRDMDAILPLSISRATSRSSSTVASAATSAVATASDVTTAATRSTWSTVCVWVEGSRSALAGPAVGSRSTTWTWLEVRSTSPAISVCTILTDKLALLHHKIVYCNDGLTQEAVPTRCRSSVVVQPHPSSLVVALRRSLEGEEGYR
jgi:hypothetical protein